MRHWNIGWGTISKCNMNCRFCYSKETRKNSSDLSYEHWVRFIDENYEMIHTINYGTGENALDYDWFRLVDYISNNYPQIRQALTTNGYLSEAVKDDYCKEVFIKGIDEVDVSLDFCDSKEHNSFRKQDKAFEWAMNTLELCRQYGKPATIVFLGSRVNMNYQNIDGLFEIAKAKNAILRMNIFRPTGGIDENSKKFIVDYDTIVDCLTYINRKYSIISLNDVLFSTILSDSTVKDPSGIESLRILADGSVTPSTYLISDDFIIANITEHNVLKRIETDSLLKKVIDFTTPKECEGCVYKLQCAGGVYDRRYLWYGTLKRKDPYCPQCFTEKNVPIITVKQTTFQSVHDGYLPTVFFSPEQNVVERSR